MTLDGPARGPLHQHAVLGWNSPLQPHMHQLWIEPDIACRVFLQQFGKLGSTARVVHCFL